MSCSRNDNEGSAPGVPIPGIPNNLHVLVSYYSYIRTEGGDGRLRVHAEDSGEVRARRMKPGRIAPSRTPPPWPRASPGRAGVRLRTTEGCRASMARGARDDTRGAAGAGDRPAPRARRHAVDPPVEPAHDPVLLSDYCPITPGHSSAVIANRSWSRQASRGRACAARSPRAGSPAAAPGRWNASLPGWTLTSSRCSASPPGRRRSTAPATCRMPGRHPAGAGERQVGVVAEHPVAEAGPHDVGDVALADDAVGLVVHHEEGAQARALPASSSVSPSGSTGFHGPMCPPSAAPPRRTDRRRSRGAA